MATTYCPECDATITADSPRMGAMIKCQECGTEFEIISTNPFDVDYPIEDYDDSYEDDEDCD
jgi:alpha-aminoadipate carrier protein LysW